MSNLKYILSLLFFVAHSALATQAEYIACKEQALNQLDSRYKHYFASETGNSRTYATSNTYYNDYLNAKANCNSMGSTTSSQYLDCVDNVLNSAATRYSAYLPSDASLIAQNTDYATFETYQSDYRSAESKCSTSNLSNQDSCISTNQRLIDQCNSDSQSAANNCDPNKNNEMNNIIAKAQTQAQSLAQTQSGSDKSNDANIQKSCQAVQSLMQQSQSAVDNYKSSCVTAKNSCLASCASAKEALKTCLTNEQATSAYQSVFRSNDACYVLAAKTTQADQAIQNLQQTQSQAANCADNTASTLANASGSLASKATELLAQKSLKPSSDPNSEYCQQNPTVSSCIASCDRSDLPTTYNSQVCVCYRSPANCQNKELQKAMSGLSGTDGSTTASSGSTGSDNINLGGADNESALNALAEKLRQSRGSTNSSDDVGGKQGAGAPVGAAGGGPGGGGNKAAASGGVAGGSGSSSGFYGTSGGSGGTLLDQFQKGVSDVYNKLVNKPATPDLRMYMPGGIKDPSRRQIAGSQALALDGVSGAETSNWLKMNNRYNVLKDTFLP